MLIKSAGTYFALGSHYAMIFRAVGEFPFFKIVNAIILNDYMKGGELREVKENSIEVQGLINHPGKFAIASLDDITEDASFKEIDFESGGEEVALDPETEANLIEKIKYIDMPHSGVHINSLYYDMMVEFGTSIPQNRIIVSVLRKKIKNASSNTNRTNL